MDKPEFVILRNEVDNDHDLWARACENHENDLNYRIVNLTANNWLEEIFESKVDYLLAKPSGLSSPFKQIYDERVYILNRVLGLPVFPSLDEILIYENKRFLSGWLAANQIPHPFTRVFYFKTEAIDFISSCVFPIVAKTNIGASGSGIKILKNRSKALQYINRSFDGRGAPRRWGPNFEKWGIIKRGTHYIFHPFDIKKKFKTYRTRKQDDQKGFVLFQEYIPHDFEWRIVRIGDSFFAHKKLKLRDKASGSLLKEYDNPPLAILDFLKKITDKHQFYSQAIDIFESHDRGYLVNEMQCIFGQSDPYQMLVNGKPGRYVNKKRQWIFEKGNFNTNNSFDLRLEHVIALLNKNKP